MVSKATVKVAKITQTIPDILTSNASAHSSRFFWSGQWFPDRPAGARGLRGDMPLDRVEIFGPSALNKGYILGETSLFQTGSESVTNRVTLHSCRR